MVKAGQPLGPGTQYLHIMAPLSDSIPWVALGTTATGTVLESVRVKASLAEGWEFESQLSQDNDLYNLYWTLSNLAFGTSKVGQCVVRSISGYVH